MDGFMKWLKAKAVLGAVLLLAALVYFVPKVLVVLALLALAYYLYKHPGSVDF